MNRPDLYLPYNYVRVYLHLLLGTSSLGLGLITHFILVLGKDNQHLGRKRMVARFSVLDKYECPTDFFGRLHSLGSMDPEAKSAAPSVRKGISTANGVARRHLGGCAESRDPCERRESIKRERSVLSEYATAYHLLSC